MENLQSILESILFAAERPVSLARFQEVFGENPPEEDSLKESLAAIRDRFQDGSFGFELREAQGGYQFITKPGNAEYVRRFLETKPFRLGRSALEVLAIIAYRQPITRAEIDSVRGIDSSHLLRTLIERGIVQMDGKAEVPGRPVQYGTTKKFLEVVGLNNVSELPPLSEFEQLQGDTEDPIKALETGLDRWITDGNSIQEKFDEQAGLVEINSMIDSAHQGTKEVYESKEQALVAEENERAVEALNSHPRPRRKKSIKFEELQAPEATEAQEGSEVLPGMDEVKPPEPTVN